MLEKGTKIPLFSEGNATADDVLDGKTFSTEKGNNLKGNIPIQSYLVKYPTYHSIEFSKGFYEYGGKFYGIKDLGDVAIREILDKLIKEDNRKEILDNIINPNNTYVVNLIKEKVPMFNNCFNHEVIEFEVPAGTKHLAMFLSNEYDINNTMIRYEISISYQGLKAGTRKLTVFNFDKYGFLEKDIGKLDKDKSFRGDQFRISSDKSDHKLEICPRLLFDYKDLDISFTETYRPKSNTNCDGQICFEKNSIIWRVYGNDRYKTYNDYHVKVELMGLKK